ncbi:MAG: multidrug effflux MFS transporter [Alcaligenaceae bacterium]|nr:multidrug effflux MFS transporter [Alcaligenaceae bacterium]
MSNIRVLTLMLAGLAMLGPFAIDTYLPAFDRIANDFGVESVLMQHTLSIYLLSFAFMSLFWGTLSDTFGRRPVIIAGLVIFLIGSVGSTFAPSYGWLLFFRGLQGCSAGAGRIVGQALARDRYQGAEAQRLFANIAMVFGLAPAIAPIVGGYLSTYVGWRSIFAMLTVLTLLLIAASWRYLPETLPPKARQPIDLRAILRNYFHVVRNTRFLLAITAVGLAFSGFGLYIASAARFILDILQLPETAFGWLFVPFIIGTISGSMLSSRLAGKVAAARLILVGQGIMGLGALGNVLYNVFFVATVPWAVVPITIYGFGMSTALPGMTVVTLSMFPRLRGMASSVQSTMQMLVFAAVAGFVAPLLFGSALLLACGTVGSAVLCAVLWQMSERMGARTAQ